MFFRIQHKLSRVNWIRKKENTTAVKKIKVSHLSSFFFANFNSNLIYKWKLKDSIKFKQISSFEWKKIFKLAFLVSIKDDFFYTLVYEILIHHFLHIFIPFREIVLLSMKRIMEMGNTRYLWIIGKARGNARRLTWISFFWLLYSRLQIQFNFIFKYFLSKLNHSKWVLILYE